MLNDFGFPCKYCKKDFRGKGKKEICEKCRTVLDRMRNRKFNKKIKEEIWQYIKKNGLKCYYSGVDLEVESKHYKYNPYYLTFDHVFPGSDRKVVIAAAVFNEMKSDLNEGQFKGLVLDLADHFRLKTIVPKQKLPGWSRVKRVVGKNATEYKQI